MDGLPRITLEEAIGRGLTFGELYALDKSLPDYVNTGGRTDGLCWGTNLDEEAAIGVDPKRAVVLPPDCQGEWRSRSRYPTTRLGRAVWGIRREIERDSGSVSRRPRVEDRSGW